MATTLKTIEYAWNTDMFIMTGSIPYTSSVIPVFFPETGSDRKFTSCWLELVIRDANAATSTRGSVGFRNYSLLLDGVSTGTHADTGQTSLGDTVEQTAYLFTADFTKEFQAITGSATGSTVAFSFYYLSGSGSDPAFTDLTGKLNLTYEYNTNTNRRVKTVTIPCDKTGSVLTTLTEIPSTGNPQVPLLNTFCPESNKSFKNIWFEVEGNEYLGGTTDIMLTMSLDNEASSLISFYEMANGLGTSMKVQWVRNDIDTSTTHSVKMATNVAGGFYPTMVLLKATYEYDHNASDTILNSVLIPYHTPSQNQPFGGVYTYWYDQFSVVEPAPIDLKQSGFWTYYGVSSTGPVYQVFINTGSVLGDFAIAANQPCSNAQCYRFDNSGSIKNCRMPINRGYNPMNIKLSIAGNSENRASGLTGYLCVNYHSGKHPSGDHVHNRNVRRLMFSGSLYSNAQTGKYLPNCPYTASIPDTNYYINAYGIEYPFSTTGFASKAGLTIMNKSIGPSDYISNLQFWTASHVFIEGSSYPSVASGFSEQQWGKAIWADITRQATRYPQQIPEPRKGVGIYNPRVYHTASIGTTFFNQQIEHIVYHGITYTVTGSLISGSAGDNIGIKVGLYRSDNRELITTGSTTSGGAYSLITYDNTVPAFVEAMSGSTGAGRSIDRLPG